MAVDPDHSTAGIARQVVKASGAIGALRGMFHGTALAIILVRNAGLFGACRRHQRSNDEFPRREPQHVVFRATLRRLSHDFDGIAAKVAWTQILSPSTFSITPV
jgi:hypothetical protein